MDQRDFVALAAHCAESLAVFRDLAEPRGIASALHMMAVGACAQGDYRAGEDYLKQSLTIFAEGGYRAGMIDTLAALAEALVPESPARAARIWGGVEVPVRN